MTFFLVTITLFQLFHFAFAKQDADSVIRSVNKSYLQAFSVAKTNGVAIRAFVIFEDGTKRMAGYYVNTEDGWLWYQDLFKSKDDIGLTMLWFSNRQYMAALQRDRSRNHPEFLLSEPNPKGFVSTFVTTDVRKNGDARPNMLYATISKRMFGLSESGPFNFCEFPSYQGTTELVPIDQGGDLVELRFNNPDSLVQMYKTRIDLSTSHIVEFERIGAGAGEGHNSFVKFGKWQEFYGSEIPQDLQTRFSFPDGTSDSFTIRWERATPAEIGFKPEQLFLRYYGLPESDAELIKAPSYALYWWIAVAVIAVLTGAGTYLYRKTQ